MLQARVPVFMLLALYLSTMKWMDRRGSQQLGCRLQRLAVPLVGWGVLQFAFYRLWNALAGHWPGVTKPFDVETVLLGHDTHLYFLPWLICATLLVYFATTLIERLRFKGAALLVGSGFIAVFVAAVIFAGGNAHPGYLPFYHTWLVAKLATYSISALPYVGIAILFHAAPAVHLRAKWGFALAFTGLAVNHFAGVSTSLAMLISACGALVFGLALPPVRLPAFVQNASRAAYGIYLSHMLIFFLVGKVAKRFGVYPDHFASLLGMAIATFLGAWAVSVVIERIDLLRWLLLGAPGEKRRPTSTIPLGPVSTGATPALQPA